MTTDEQRIFVCEKLFGWKWYRHPSANSLSHPHYRFLAHPAVHEIDQSPQWMVAADMSEKPCSMEYMEREFFLPPLTLDWLHECLNNLDETQLDRFTLVLIKIVAPSRAHDFNWYADRKTIAKLLKAPDEHRLAALVTTLGGKV